ERLDEVVVGAGVEPGDAILDRVARGEHEHGRPDAAGPEPPARLEAADPRQHDVEHDRVVVGGARHPDGVLAARRDVRGEPLLDEAAADQTRHPRLVLDDQHAHAPIVPRGDERRMKRHTPGRRWTTRPSTSATWSTTSKRRSTSTRGTSASA